MKKVTKILLDEDFQTSFRKNFEKAGLNKLINNEFIDRASNFFNKHGQKYASGGYDEIIDGVKSSFKNFFKKQLIIDKTSQIINRLNFIIYYFYIQFQN